MGKAHKSRSTKNSGAKRPAPTTVPCRLSKRQRLLLAPLGVVVAAVLTFAALCYRPGTSVQSVAGLRAPATLGDLLALAPQQLERVDLAVMNLLCAQDLPGAENLDIPKMLTTLDQWAVRVKQETDRHLYRFRRDPAAYSHSEGYFRMLMLVTVLQQDLGIHYNMDRVREIDFRRSQDLFIHGMIGNTNGGTCVSMPAIYAAVARRLGYPVKLVQTRAHVFCRWDAPNDRFNIEATSQGMNSYPDHHYRTWPEKVSDAEMQANRYLVSLSPAEELACFLASRGHCLLDNGRTSQAIEAYGAANRLEPKNPAYLAWAQQAQQAPLTDGGPNPPALAEVERIIARQRDDRLGHGRERGNAGDALAEVEQINAMNRANMQRLLQPWAAGIPQSPLPPRPNLGLPQPYPPPGPEQPPMP